MAKKEISLWVREVPCSILASGKGFMLDFFCFVALVFLLSVQKHNFTNPFAMFNYLVHLTYFNISDRL